MVKRQNVQSSDSKDERCIRRNIERVKENFWLNTAMSMLCQGPLVFGQYHVFYCDVEGSREHTRQSYFKDQCCIRWNSYIVKVNIGRLFVFFAH